MFSLLPPVTLRRTIQAFAVRAEQAARRLVPDRQGSSGPGAWSRNALETSKVNVPKTPDTRITLLTLMEETRAGFHTLLDRLDDDDLRRQSRNPRWTNGAVLTHLILSLKFIPREVAAARRGKGMFNFPPFLFDPINAVASSVLARRQTRQSLRKRYDDACAAAVRALDDVTADELGFGANFYGRGFHTVRALFESQARHLAEHGADIVGKR